MPESASMYVTYAENQPSFQSVGVYDSFPLTVTDRDASEQIRAVGASRGVLETLRVQPMLGRAYFRTSGMPVVAGREYTESDLDGLRPVAIVSKSLATQLWGSPAAALGQRVRPDPNAPWRDVIDVVETCGGTVRIGRPFLRTGHRAWQA